MKKQETTNKELQKAIRERNFYLAAAKVNKGVSLAIYYVGLVGGPVAGIVGACHADNFAEGTERVLAGVIMGTVAIGCASVIRQLNVPLLRDYVQMRNQVDNQKAK